MCPGSKVNPKLTFDPEVDLPSFCTQPFNCCWLLFGSLHACVQFEFKPVYYTVTVVCKKFSMESMWSKVYSSDLRWKMVYQSCLEVAKRLNVDPTTVSRTAQLFEERGTVCSIQGYHENTLD